jgi:RNA polymerase sigma factor (sigma-70 family)
MPESADPTPVLRYLRSALGPGAEGPSDDALLSRFVAERDEAAFELLVWRHAGMVLRVGRGVLRDYHAAEDVAQAAFLALARKAGSLGRRQAVAVWLHRVAYRLAVRHGRKRSPSAADLDQLPARPASADPELAKLLHAELDRLPEKYRAPLLLCFFDGLTHAETAKRLGWPVGTVAGRIARAKELLRARLTRRGVAVPVAGLSALFAADAASAVAPSFAGLTARAAIAYVAGEAIIPGVSGTVLELTKGAMRTMILTKLQWAAGLCIACGALTLGGVWAAGQGPGKAAAGALPATKPAAEAAKPWQPEPVWHKATATDRKRSLNNLQRITVAFHNYLDVYGYLPRDIRDKNGKKLLSWRVAILPFIEQNALYQQFKLDEPWDSDHNKKLLAQMPDIYRTNFQPKTATETYYQVFTGPTTALGPKAAQPAGEQVGGSAFVPLGGSAPDAAGAGSGPQPAADGRMGIQDITDGTSNTFGVIEAGPPVPWTKPADIPYDPKKPLPKLPGPFSNELHVATMDAAVHALTRDIPVDVARHLIERADGIPTPELKKFRAPLTAVTPEEKAALQKLLDRNQELIAEIDQLMKEHVKLLGTKNQVIGDWNLAEEQAEKLKQIADGLRAKNKQIRDDLGLRPGATIPKSVK